MSIVTIAILSLCPMSCTTQNARTIDSIPFTVANNYFAIVDVDSISHYKITSEEEFNKLFNMAAHMGKDGTPTPIDFSKQYAIAVVLPTSNHQTDITDINISPKTDGTACFNYSIKTDSAEMSYSIRPMALVIIDKKYDIPIRFL